MELLCKFHNIAKGCYTSFIHLTAITKPNMKIQSITGKHLEGKNHEDVDAICFEHTTVNYFPHGLNKIFPNLKTVVIRNCRLKSITQRDLVGLENIRKLWCDENKITSLPDNLFRNMHKLIHISFRDNDLHFMSSEILKPILNNGLNFVDFRLNRSIDAAYSLSSYLEVPNKVDSVAQLMAMIDEKCQNTIPINDNCNRNIAPEGFKELWTTGRFSDITIVTDTEKFKVHKVVLAIQSSVFTAIFDNETKDRSSDEIQMKNINPAVVKMFLKCLYTNEVEKEEVSNLLELFSLAAKFKVENLMSVVEKMIIDNLNIDNAMDVFELACRFNYDGMKTSAFEVIQSMFDEPLKVELMNQPEVVKELVEAKINFNSIPKKQKIA